LKITPFVMLATVVLLSCVGLILYGLISTFSDEEQNSRFVIGLTGDTDSDYIKWGITAMSTLDESRFSIDFIKITPEEAEKRMAKGDLSAYVIIPEGFVEKAMRGEVDTVTYVTAPGTESVTSIFKKEITSLVTELVIYSQKGSYGVGQALADNGYPNYAHEHMEKISLDYAEIIFRRNTIHLVQEVGVSDGLSTTNYYICAIIILALSLIGIPFGAILIKKDYSFPKLLASRGGSYLMQITCELASYFLAMLLQVVLIFLFFAFAAQNLPFFADLYDANLLLSMVLRILPISLMLSAWNFMLFELSDNPVSGLLLSFFSSVCLLYISGCMYPSYAFPTVIQKLGSVLPTGLARSYLSSAFTQEEGGAAISGLLGYTVLFFLLAWAVRRSKTTRKGG
jgi:ABC-2 type transport system permease protein